MDKNQLKIYHKKYYENRKSDVIRCDRCDKEIKKCSINMHQQTKYCLGVYNAKDENNIKQLNEQKDKDKEDKINALKKQLKNIQLKLNLLYDC
jgi:hypothetical protein